LLKNIFNQLYKKLKTNNIYFMGYQLYTIIIFRTGYPLQVLTPLRFVAGFPLLSGSPSAVELLFSNKHLSPMGALPQNKIHL
jgi:hypothetical protein